RCGEMGNSRPASGGSRTDESGATSRANDEPARQHATTAPARVLILDDDPVLVESLSDLLREEGYEAEGYTDARAALERLKAGPLPGVLLLDYLMPLMTGEEFLDALEASNIEVNVLLFTALHESALPKAAGRVAGMIRKPFDIEPLLEAIARIT